MIKTSLKKSLLLLISTTLVGLSVILACAGGWYSINDTTNYTPELFVDKSYSPFFYSYDYYYDIGHDEKQNERFNATVVSDWYNYLDKKFSINEIETILFKTTNKSIDSILKSKIPTRFSSLQIVTSKDKKVIEFYNYLNLAKQAESFALTSQDDWSYDDKPKKERASSTNFCASVLIPFNACKDKFIKQRYLFQLVRAYFFNKNYANCVSVFESNQSTTDKNIMYYRTMCYAAGSLKKMGKLSQANYYYSIVYNNCNDLKTTAHYSFKPQEESDWQKTLALCKTDDEKCTLWQMLGVFYKDEQHSLEEIIKLNPKSDKCDLLISRAVNKLENDLLEPKSEGDMQAYSNKDIKTLLKNYIALFQTAITKNIDKPYQWQMALGYLQTLDKDYKNADLNFKAAEKSLANSGNMLLLELRLLKIINSISEIKLLNKTTEDKLLPELEWLSSLAKDEKLKGIRTITANSWMQKIMNKKYREQKDFLKAEFYNVDQAFYVNEKQLHDMQNFLLKTNKTPYEKYCESIYTLNINQLYEFEAIDKTFNDDIDAAVILMEKAGVNGETILLSNPFNGGIKDCHDCDHAQAQKTKYSKISTLKIMKGMKDKLSTDTYNNALLLGNVYYNMTFFGSSRMFYYCAIIDAGSTMPDMINASFVNKLTDMTLAKKYYTQALDVATSDEQKAKCTYLLSKCERNEWYNKNGNKDGLDFIAFKNFSALKKYANTKYYKEVIAECGYFNKYAKK